MNYVARKAATVDHIPVVDFAPFLSGDPELKAQAVQAIARACETAGFFYLSNHGIPQAKLDGILAAARRFFALPEETLRSEHLLSSAANYRGYAYVGARDYGDEGRSLNETFKFQIELPENDPDILSGATVHRRNRWPVDMPDWRATLVDYFNAVTNLSHQLLQSFALALGLEENYFRQFYQKPLTQISLLHYPPQPPNAPSTDFGVVPHFDATSFTILLQDDVGGLEVQGPDGVWIPAVPIPGTFVINIGYMMARWTNDRFTATMHRVYNRGGQERYSVPFFNIPDHDAVIAVLPECQQPGTPPRFEPLHVGQAVLKQFTSNWA